MTEGKTIKLIVRTKDWYCNIPVTHIEKIDSLVYAYRGENFIGMFDLGSVDNLYLSESREG